MIIFPQFKETCLRRKLIRKFSPFPQSKKFYSTIPWREPDPGVLYFEADEVTTQQRAKTLTPQPVTFHLILGRKRFGTTIFSRIVPKENYELFPI